MQVSDPSQSTENTHKDDDTDELDAEKEGFESTEAHSSDSAIIIQLQEELKDAKDRALRVMAEMENLRKRTEREKVDIHKYAVESLVKDLVPFLDSLEKASEEFAKQADNPEDGLGMIYKQFISTLTKHGLEVIQSAGAAFNPNFHQAIQKSESADVKVDTVQTEFAKGYLLNGRLVRPAIVSVTVPKPQAAQPISF